MLMKRPAEMPVNWLFRYLIDGTYVGRDGQCDVFIEGDHYLYVCTESFDRLGGMTCREHTKNGGNLAAGWPMPASTDYVEGLPLCTNRAAAVRIIAYEEEEREKLLAKLKG